MIKKNTKRMKEQQHMREIPSKQPPQLGSNATPSPPSTPALVTEPPRLSPTAGEQPREPQACLTAPSPGKAQLASPSPLLLQHVPGMPTASWGHISLEVLPALHSSQPFWKVAQVTRSLPSSAEPTREQSVASQRSSPQPWDAPQPFTQPFGKQFN